MKLCPNCRKFNDDSMNFCLNCGAPIVNSAAPPQPQQQAQFGRPPQVISPPRVRRKRSSKMVWLILCAAGVLGFVFLFSLFVLPLLGVLFAVSSSINTNTNTNTNSNRSSNVSRPVLSNLSNSALTSQANGKDKNANGDDDDRKPLTEPKTPTAKAAFQFDASASGWQTSDIFVVPNENYILHSKGTVKVSGLGTLTAKGAKKGESEDRRINKEFATAALLMRTRNLDGSISSVVAVESDETTGFWITEPEERGFLEFCLNDNTSEDNQGQLNVEFVAISSSPQNGKK